MPFRSAAPEDWPTIARLLTEASLPLEGAEEALSGFLLAFDSRKTLLGSAALERYDSDTALLRSVAVRKTARGEGWGTRLVQTLLNRAREAGIREIWLLTTTADGYFPRFGFQPADRKTAPAALRDSIEFREACPASAIAMRLILAEERASIELPALKGEVVPNPQSCRRSESDSER